MSPSISVIIPAHNEERYLGPTLDALEAQTYRYFETIVVANGCSDHTEEVAGRRCDKLLHVDERGLSHARNLGGMKARGEILVFLDADTLLETDALATIAQQFRRHHAMGTLKGQPDSNRFAYRLIYLVKNLLHKFHLHYGSSGVIVCWRDYFKAVGGFDETLHLCEISDFMNKLARLGKYKYINATRVTTSMRRYEKKGAVEMLWLWLKVWLISIFSDLKHRAYEPVR
jgi:glycosyltransferase involved in cell wall biosynthesis